jgi:clan AA aspartic protease (TIGR02281 family)
LRDRLRRATLAEADGRLQAGDAGEALAVLARAVRQDPTHAAYHQRLGMTYLALGDGGRALASLEQAVGLDPALAEVVGGLVADLRGRGGADGAVAVPLERRLGVLYVTVRVNGHPAPLRMVLDTGASHTALTRRSATLLGLWPGPGTPQLWVDTVSERVPAFLVTLEEVEVGGVVARDVPALVLESVDDGDGLLGLSFLRRFNVEVRERAGQLVLSPR